MKNMSMFALNNNLFSFNRVRSQKKYIFKDVISANCVIFFIDHFRIPMNWTSE